MFTAALCGPDQNTDDCAVEVLLLLWPYYIFLLLFLPFRMYEIRVLPSSYPPKWWPMSHLLKRMLTLSQIVVTTLAMLALFYVNEAHLYLILSCIIHILCWGAAYFLLGCEYKRYQPVTWLGLRGFWFLTGVEACIRVTWMITSPIDSTPDYLTDYPAISAISIAVLSLTQLAAMVIAVLIPSDLNVNLLSHIQRLLLEHPYENFASNSVPSSSFPNVYTLHEEDNNPQMSDGYQSRRADVPGWIYSVEEELPFSPKIDIIDIHVLAINEGRTIKTVYRIQTRVTTDTIVVEFNARRRYKELRYLDDRLRAVFDHSRFPEQRASMGSFPPRELTQADPFARQIALREYLRRLSESPVFYVQEFLDMVGVDPRFDCGRLYEQCLVLQRSQLERLPVRRQRTHVLPLKHQPAGSALTNEPVPWRPPAPVLVPSADDSAGSPALSTPVGPISPSLRITVTIPDYMESSKKVVYYRIVTKTQFGMFESRHRFSDFQRLAVHLRDFLDVRPSVDLPRLVRFSQPQAEFLQERRACLEKYLQTLVAESPGIISSRLVRSFFKLPADPLMLSAVPPVVPTEDEEDSELLVSSSSRLTPTATAFPTNLSEPELTTPPPPPLITKPFPGGSPSPINRDRKETVVISVPFFCYNLDTVGAPDFVFCIRVGVTNDDWIRFHSFEDFLRLRNSLAVAYPSLVEAIPDFPPKRSIWTGAADVPGIKVENDGRKIVLARWLAEVVKRALTVSGSSDKRIEDVEHACPALFDFVRCVDDSIDQL